MKGPLNLRFKLLGESCNVPMRAFMLVTKGGISQEEVEQLRIIISQQTAHLILVVTDRGPSTDVLGKLELLPQIVLTTVEQRDLVKLLVVGLAKSSGEDIDKDLLVRAYSIMFEKFGLRAQLTKWFERLAEKGYLLDFEGFVDRTVNACRFFINSMGKPLTLEKCWKESWAFRDLLPFGIDSKIIPDMGLEDLEKHVEILRSYGFIEEKKGKYFVKRHQAEQRVMDLIENHGGTINQKALFSYFLGKEANSYIFDSLLEHMARKLLISREHRDLVQFLSLADVKSQRDQAVRLFGQKKMMLENTNSTAFAQIITWKERGWSLIDLEFLRNTVENLLSEISIATDEDVLRSRTFLILELVNWYSAYVDKTVVTVQRSKDMTSVLESEVNNLKNKATKVINNLIKATKTGDLRVELQELQRAQNELNELNYILTETITLEEMEKMFVPLAGEKKSKNIERSENLRTDIDEEMKSKGTRGEWAIAKYVLMSTQARKVRNETQGLDEILVSLDSLSADLVKVAEEIPAWFFEDASQKSDSKIKVFPLLLDESRQIAEGFVKKSPFLLNVKTITITELRNALEEHVQMLKEENANAQKVRGSLDSLKQTEIFLVDNLQKANHLGMLYEAFWEEKIPDAFKAECSEAQATYDTLCLDLDRETVTLSDFTKVERKTRKMIQDLEEILTKSNESLNHVRVLFDDTKYYARVGMTFVERFRKNLLPKLTKSNKTRIQDVLNELYVLYEWCFQWINQLLEKALKGVSLPEVPKTRTSILVEERNLREALIKEVKDLEKQETNILLELTNLSATARQSMPLSEVSETIGKKLGITQDIVKKILLDIAERGLLTLSVTF